MSQNADTCWTDHLAVLLHFPTGGKVGVTAYTSCTLTFFAPRSTIVMRKLRTWPVRTGSAFASLAEGPFFHRDASMAPSEDKSGAPACDCSFAATSRVS